MEARKLRGGMIGGGPGALIGPVHRMAATLDGQADFVAGVFSSRPEKSKQAGQMLFLDPARVYDSYQAMAEAEAAKPPEERLDFVSIVTPNNTHFEIAKTFLDAGFHVICDKPMTFDLAQAKELERIANGSGRVFALTHNYTGYPMVKQARHVVRSGALGRVNKVVVEYPQGWLSAFLRDESPTIAPWRMNPEVAGASCCMGDIGTHAENLARTVTGLEIEELSADLTAFIDVNQLDDDGAVLLRYKGGARGVLMASQISTGEENALRLRVYGTEAGLEWSQEDPNYLYVTDARGIKTRYSKGNEGLCPEAVAGSRIPPGHPESFIEAFGNVYLSAFSDIRKQQSKSDEVPEDLLVGPGGPQSALAGDYPTVRDGVIGMAFIETVVENAGSDRKWTAMKA